MCIQNVLQQYILDITNDGKDVADFFHATMQGRTPNAQIHHQMEAAKQLRTLGLHTDDITVRPEPRPELVEWPVEGHAKGEQPADNSELNTQNSPVTDHDIINYEVAALIRGETGDGYFIADFLARVMRGAAGQGRPVSPADRMRAAKELMNRGLGRFGDTRDRRIYDSREDHEIIHSGLSRYIRERTDNGLHAVRFLLDVASGQEQSFSMHQRVVATRELVRRGWDTNYDAITPEDIAAYRERQDTLDPTEHDIRLREWRDNERAAQDKQANPCEDKSLEDEPQLESGIFAHLTNAEVACYEAMSVKDQEEFIEQQRQLRATRQSDPSVISTLSPLSLRERARVRGADNAPSSSTGEGWDGSENHENADWNTIIQEISAPSRTPHPPHPVSPRPDT